ncbi:MAG: hypothetical protein JWP20_105 [Roseomonas sp.]|nr:hypothetical protein [Roseomonas sp.]
MPEPALRAPAPGPGRTEGSVPSYDLYGERQVRASLDPVHLESLFLRSQRHDWNIRPHRHRNLHQVFWVQDGGGTMEAAGLQRPFLAPVLLVVPLGEVHGFRFQPGSSGHVLTLTDAFLAASVRLTQEHWNPGGALDIALGQQAALRDALNAAFAGLDAEFRRAGTGRGAAVAGYVLQVLSLLQRCAAAEASARHPYSAQAHLVARFRENFESRLSEHATLQAQCRQLGVTPSTLTRACRAITGSAPLELIQQRLMLEARRMLTYSAMNVSQVAYALGFEPSYFSRFFTRHEGLSPAAFQRAAAAMGGLA